VVKKESRNTETDGRDRENTHSEQKDDIQANGMPMNQEGKKTKESSTNANENDQIRSNWKNGLQNGHHSEQGCQKRHEVERQAREGDDDVDLEVSMAGFEALFDRMRSIRNNSANLSDADRRDVAQAAIMELLIMEGLDLDDI